MKRIAILASGGGSNAQKIMEYFSQSDVAEVVMLISNNPNAGALNKAKSFSIRSEVHTTEEMNNGNLQLLLEDNRVDIIVLAGYIKKVSREIVASFKDSIVNIHPALLPKYGGKGMFGLNVHRAVKEAAESESGMTIHYVNEHYDEGAIIRQESVQLETNDTAEDIARKVLKLEHRYYAPTIEQILKT